MVKKKKLLKAIDKMMVGVEEEDRISKLSDPLLCYILSFLPFECIVVTSVLAKRWRFVWNSVSILKIKHLLSSDPAKDSDLHIKQFVNFMDRMFILRDLSTIKYFSLFTYIEDEYNINSWISAVIKRKVEEIELLLVPHSDAYYYSPFLIPSSLFTCESLIKLNIAVRVDLNLPKYVHFPKLKRLRLMSVRIKDKYFIEQLLANCPVLEDLSLDSCTWDGIDDLCVSSPTLKRLCIGGRPILSCGEVKINAPLLEYLSYTHFLVKKHVLQSFPVLVRAQIHPAAVNSESIIPEQGSSSIKLLGELFNVKHLYVHDRLFKALSLTDDHFLLKLPTFHNLSDLRVIWSYPSSIDKALLRLLQISPKLESLVFHNGNDCQSNKDDSWKLNIVPEGPNIVSGLEHLKVLEFLEFCGDPWEMYVVELFLKNARFLQRLTVQTDYNRSTLLRKNRLQIARELLMLPRASSSCVDPVVSLALSTTCVYGRGEGKLTRLQISCQKRTVAGNVAAVCYLSRNFALESTFRLLVSASAMNLLGS